MNKIIKKKLEELEVTRHQYWNIHPDSGKFLNLLIKGSNIKKVLEVGMSNGYSAIWMAEALRQTKGQLTTIEFHECRVIEAIENYKTCDLTDYIDIKRGAALEILDQLDEVYDLVFLDANKAEYLEYFKKIEDKVKPNGYIVADNTVSHEKKVMPFLDAIRSHENYDTVDLPFDGGMLMAIRK